jgi:hypothetical protein
MTLAADTTNNTVHFCFIRSVRWHKRHRQSIIGSFYTKAKLRF